MTTSSDANADGLTFRALTLYDIEWVETVVSEHFGSPRVVSRSVLHQVRDLAGLVALRDGETAGLLQYHVDDPGFEVVILIALIPRLGVGRSLLDAAEPLARAAGCHRMWLITTNNNAKAIAFYRAIGWRQVAVHRRAVRAARRLKPEIPLTDSEGRPIDDEIEFERALG